MKASYKEFIDFRQCPIIIDATSARSMLDDIESELIMATKDAEISFQSRDWTYIISHNKRSIWFTYHCFNNNEWLDLSRNEMIEAIEELLEDESNRE